MRGLCILLVISSLIGLGPALSQTDPEVVPVATLANPQQLANMHVVDSGGGLIGRILGVKTGSDGKANRVMVLLSASWGMGRVAAMRPERLRLNKNYWPWLVVATYSAAQLTQLAQTATTPPPDIDWMAARP